MRNEDIEKLKETYSFSGPGDYFARTLDVEVKNARELSFTILNDLSIEKLGIFWWYEYKDLGTKRRILISDYLYQACYSIQSNLTEAKLHYMYLLKSWDDEARFISKGAGLDLKDNKQFRMPERKAPIDHLSSELIDLHLAGFLRSIVSALDCLGTTVIGVMGLPIDLLRSDFGKAHELLKTLPDSPSDEKNIQSIFKYFFLETVKKSGPEGWISWTSGYRNMIVHRGRRMTLNQIFMSESGLINQRGIRLPKAEMVQTFPQDPSVSEIEAFLDKSTDIMLTENAKDTVEGILESTKYLIDNISRELISNWDLRKKNPNLLIQPRKQWEKIKDSKKEKFPGYNRNSINISPTAFITKDVMQRRMLAASVTDDLIEKWKSFD